MSEGNIQRLYLACGSAVLLIFSAATAVAIATFGDIQAGDGVQADMIAVIALAVTMAILLLNETLLCSTSGGPKVLSACRTLLWISLLLMVFPMWLCIVLMAHSL